MTTRRRLIPPKGDWNYRQLWRIVDGAVADAFKMHPDYIAEWRRESDVRRSINKRVVGAVLGYAKQSAQALSGSSSGRENANALIGARAMAQDPAVGFEQWDRLPNGRPGGVQGHASHERAARLWNRLRRLIFLKEACE